MGNDATKVEKKKAKAQAKIEKAKASTPAKQEIKIEKSTVHIGGGKAETNATPWYKNPSWVRTIVAVISLIITIIAIALGLYYK
ncbi:MAG: hypothetical protein ABIG20_01850 [archaeon]